MSFWNLFKRAETALTSPERPSPAGFFSMEAGPAKTSSKGALLKAQQHTFQVKVENMNMVTPEGQVMDSGAFGGQPLSVKGMYDLSGDNMGDLLISWFGNQGFLGYPMLSMISQHWLVDKVCTIPARDAIRHGYEITVNDGTQVAPEIIEQLYAIDRRMNIREKATEYVRMARIFGIRAAMFLVDGIDYSAPFNSDGVKPGSYKGFVQIDPQWMTPEMDTNSLIDPTMPGFYEPTWWRIGQRRVHKSHLVINVPSPVPDNLKPTYRFGGISIPQKIYERVYAAERTANEAPILVQTKRLNVLNVDMDKVIANPERLGRSVQLLSEMRDNHGVQVLGIEEKVTQLETSLTELAEVIDGQYHLVAAAGNVPVTKLFATSATGLNATGEGDESNYHEELESIQSHDLTPLLQRHHMLIIRSELPKVAGLKKPFSTEIKWPNLDSPTAKEQAETNLLKAQTGTALVTSGAIIAEEERKRIIADTDSGYSGLPEEIPVSQIEEDDAILADNASAKRDEMADPDADAKE